VASAIGVSADERLPTVDDVVDLDTEIFKGGEEVGEDGNGAVLPGRRKAVVIDVLIIEEVGEGVEVVVGHGLSKSLGELSMATHLDLPFAGVVV
jgi:hypothetical protein